MYRNCLLVLGLLCTATVWAKDTAPPRMEELHVIADQPVPAQQPKSVKLYDEKTLRASWRAQLRHELSRLPHKPLPKHF